MPIYEYRCRNCDQEFELLVRGVEKPSCASCGSTDLIRQLSIPAAHTAGSASPPCPAKESGACDVRGCGGGQCGMSGWPG